MLVYVDAIAKENCAQAPNKREIQYIAVFISVPSTFSQPMSGAPAPSMAFRKKLARLRQRLFVTMSR